jgi:triphosphoribosyl-dephospho-CoA synthase
MLEIAARASIAPGFQDLTPALGHIGRLAIRSLYREVALPLKPGLVCPGSRGSHADMDFASFVRSLQALRAYFPAITACGCDNPRLPALQALGIAAERGMLAATGGVNTHRGAIFNLGLLCAASGYLLADEQVLDAASACRCVAERWGKEILADLAQAPADSHGLLVARRYGSGGARQEAAAGFPAALAIGLPAYRRILAATGDPELAAEQALFALIAEVEDSNLLWRGGPDGLAFGRRLAADFLAAGGVVASNWRERAKAIDAAFVARRLSPGGSADLLGVTLFLAELDGLA